MTLFSVFKEIKDFERKKPSDWLTSCFPLYIKISSIYFYMLSREVFFQNELCVVLNNKKTLFSKLDLNFDTPFRQRFVISSFLREGSVLFEIFQNLRQILYPCWSSSSNDLLFQDLEKSIDKVKKSYRYKNRI